MIKPRKSLSSVTTYQPPLEGRRDSIRLDFNENTQATTGYDQYPEYQQALTNLAEAYGLPQESVLLTNGSSEGIWLTAFSFIEPGVDLALVSSPTFSLIPHYLNLCGARLESIPVTEQLEFDMDALEERLYSGIKLVMLASPENPTGAVLDRQRVESWLKKYPSTLFFVDEAYAEYSAQSFTDLVGKYENLLVSRTFSKAWGLAGLRLGFLAGSASLIETLNKVRIPYNVNVAALEQLIERLPEKEKVFQEARELIAAKNKLISELEKRGYQVVPGNANFILLDAGIFAADLCQYLSGNGILVRDRSSLTFMQGKIRISMGSETEMNALLSALDSFSKDRALIFDLDDTLIDTRNSYNAVVKQLVDESGGGLLTESELIRLKAEGGFNDDWRSAQEILRRRGIQVTYQQMQKRGTELYLEIANEVESLLIDTDVLKELAKRFSLYVVTGRYRNEYDLVWGKRLTKYFREVVCVDDNPKLAAKPEPDQFLYLQKRFKFSSFCYVGNSVDDMRAAVSAGGIAIGVTTTMTVAKLQQAGASYTLDSAADVLNLPGAKK